MKKEDLLLILLLAVILLAALITLIRGGAGSRHGYGANLYHNDSDSKNFLS